MNSLERSRVLLGKVIRHRSEFIEIDDFEIYKRCRVQVNTKGIILRDKVKGIEIKTKRQQVCKAGDFLVAEIDAKMGGFGIVPPELDGAVVSSHYFLYEIDETVLNAKYLGFYIRTSNFIEQVQAQGSTNYAAIRPHDVLEYTIPLPPLEEQQRIVTRIEALATKLEEVKKLRESIKFDLEDFCRTLIFHSPDQETPSLPMRELVNLRTQDIEVSPEEMYDFAGVYSFGNGVFRSLSKQGIEFSYSKLTRLRQGDFVYPKLMAWEGAFGTVPPECDGCVVSPEFPVFEVNEDKILPETLDVYFRTPFVWEKVSGLSTGTNVRRRRLHPSNFLKFEMPVPPMPLQKKLRKARQKFNELIALEDINISDLEKMLPSILDKAFRGEL